MTVILVLFIHCFETSYATYYRTFWGTPMIKAASSFGTVVPVYGCHIGQYLLYKISDYQIDFTEIKIFVLSLKKRNKLFSWPTRLASAPNRVIIWSPLKPIFFKIFPHMKFLTNRCEGTCPNCA